MNQHDCWKKHLDLSDMNKQDFFRQVETCLKTFVTWIKMIMSTSKDLSVMNLPDSLGKFRSVQIF